MTGADLVIANGTLALPSGAVKADVAIKDGRIAAIANPGELKGAMLMDASGKLVLPGAIDMHVHFREPGFEHKEDFWHGTAAAACGGVTTVCDMPNTSPPVIDPDRFAMKLEKIAASAHVDFGLWAGGFLTEHFAALNALGAVGLKVYMNRAVRATDPYAAELSMPDDATFIAAMKAAAAYDWPISVHLANPALDEAVRATLIARGSVDPADVCCSFRSPESVEALSRAALFARIHGARLHIAHISLNAIEALDALVEQRNRGCRISAEIVPPALGFGELPHLGSKGVPFAHPEEHLERYWSAIAAGVIDAIATDHAPHTLAEKEAGRKNPWGAPPGYPGVETSLAIMIDAMLAGRLSIETLVRVTSENPARILQLPDKGAIAPGKDADLVLVNPDGEWLVDETKLHSKAGWSPFHGRRLNGRVVATLLRGSVVAKDGELVPGKPRGKQVRPRRARVPEFAMRPGKFQEILRAKILVP